MDYIRKIIYLREYKGGEIQPAKAGYARLEYRSQNWQLSIVPEEAGMDVQAPVYILVEREDNFFAKYIGICNTSCIIINREDGQFIRESERICGVRIGDGTHYLAGKCPDAPQELPVETIKIWGQEIHKEIHKEETAESEGKKIRFQPMYPFEDDEFDWCYQIEPRDIGSLPADSWHLSANSFLLQGYYNYRHLMYAHKKGKNFIGVPGQFHRREQYLAARFGFSRFKGTQKKRITMGDFGYWIRELGNNYKNGE